MKKLFFKKLNEEITIDKQNILNLNIEKEKTKLPKIIEIKFLNGFGIETKLFELNKNKWNWKKKIQTNDIYIFETKLNEETKNVADILKSNLHQGDFCPVCGEIIKEEFKINNVKNDNNIEKIQQNIFDLKIKIETRKEVLKQNKIELKNILDEVEKLKIQLKTFGNYNFKNEMENINLKTLAFEKISMEIVKIEEILIKKLENSDNVKNKILNIQNKLENLSTEGKGISQRVDEIEIEIKKAIGDENPNKLFEKLNENKNQLIENYEKFNKDLKKVNENLNFKKLAVEKLETENKFLLKITNEDEKDLEIKLTSFNFSNKEEVLLKFIEPFKIVEFEKEIENYKNKVAVVLNNFQKLQLNIQNIDIEKTENNFQILFNENNKLENEILEINQEIIRKNEKIINMESKIKDVEKLEKEKTTVTKHLDNLKILTNLFKEISFVDFIAKRHLKYISQDASKRLLKITGGKFSLELDDADFIIKDNSRGNILRSTKTLSGGEVFIVSLCLSLALSNKVQLKGNSSLDMFFLDEGFGTLDSNTLETVIDNLFSLVDDKMKIGLFTHVEELKNNLPRKLVVTSGSFEKGSSVKMV